MNMEADIICNLNIFPLPEYIYIYNFFYTKMSSHLVEGLGEIFLIDIYNRFVYHNFVELLLSTIQQTHDRIKQSYGELC